MVKPRHDDLMDKNAKKMDPVYTYLQILDKYNKDEKGEPATIQATGSSVVLWTGPKGRKKAEIKYEESKDAAAKRETKRDCLGNIRQIWRRCRLKDVFWPFGIAMMSLYTGT